MPSVNQFIKLCSERVKRGEPFLAYRHDRGMMLLRTTDGTYEEYTIEIPKRFGGIEEYTTTDVKERDRYKAKGCRVITHTKRLKVKKGSVSKLLKEIQWMRKRRTPGLCVIEFNGYGVQADGDFGSMKLQDVLRELEGASS